MNIVKGVADLIRRTSSGPTGESVPGSQLDKLSPPVPRICFSEVGKEAILYTLWERYDRENDKVEKRKSFHVFLKQFLTTYKSWEPVDSGQLADNTSSTGQPREQSMQCDPTIMGCSVGHPAEVILAFSQELVQLTDLVTELSVNMPQSAKNILEHSSGSEISEGMCLLEALSIATRSIHNCRVFGYSGGVQRLTALMKGSVVQLKTISGAVSADESLSAFSVEKIKRLQQILTLVVSIVCNFIGLTTDGSGMAKLHRNFSHSYFPRSFAFLFKAAVNTEAPLSELRFQWRQRAVVSVMEAGGLNWLVELLRVIRRLSVKDQWSDVILQYITLRTLQSALAGNSRGQNHFKSIGGLEVLLDRLGLPSDNALKLDNLPGTNDNRDGNPLLCLLELHVLSFEVLREAVFGNVNNLQFLSESGRVHKFANSFCSPVFMLQDQKVLEKLFPSEEKSEVSTYDHQNENNAGDYPAEASVPFSSTPFHSQSWNDYVSNLSRVLCSFLYIAEDNKSHVQAAVARAALLVSPVYCELSVKWILRVLGTVFPCIKACSEQNQLPVHLRVFVNKLHHTVLNTFRKILASTPLLLEVFRDEGIWDLIFSENFFYFGPALDESSEGYSLGNEDSCGSLPSSSSCNDHTMMGSGIESLQMNIMSLTELAATSGGSTHNLPEVRVLVDALEESVCNARLANILAKTLLRILQFSAERTVASLTAIDAIPRVLKVICLQAQESKKSEGIYQSVKVSEAVVSSRGQSWQRCLDTSFSLFTQLSKTDDGMKSTLGSSSCIDCLFELFWVEKLRNHVLKHVLDLMKIVPSSEEDQKAKLYLCSKYLETFTQVKEREKSFAKLSIDLLAGMRDMIRSNQVCYQDLFRDGECFLHVVSLLNGNLETDMGEELVLNVLQTLTCLLASNDVSKASFRALVGSGYQTLQSLLLDFCHWRPTEGLLNALLDMLVDGRFDVKANNIIKNEDVVVLYLSVLHKSSEFLCHHGLNLFQILLRDSLSNRASCVRAGMLSFLLDWFSEEKNDSIVVKIAQLVQVIGGHSISGKDIRKIFALLRSEKVGARQQYCSLLLTSVLSMLNEKGPTAFFDLNGSDSGIKIRTPIQWPQNKGFSFSCWLRVESFPRGGTMSLFSFLTENGRGCAAVLSNDRLIVESSNLKRQSVQLQLSLMKKRWHFLCITHSIGRAFSGGSLLKCYVDGKLVSSERCSYAKVNELLTQCTIGAKVSRTVHEEDSTPDCRDSFAFHGQIGPVYMFTDAISPEVIQRICFLGPSYMYSFVDNEDASSSSSQLPSGLLDLKDGLASKVLFGLNAQASDGKILLNASAISDHVLDRNSFEAIILPGTQLCSRRLLQQIIYCVGGVSVFFPLIAQDRYENEESGELEDVLLTPVTKERLTAEVIELIASVLDENMANQQQMLLLSGFSVLGFLLQSLPPQQLNLATLSAMKHLFNVIASCGLAEQLVGDAISHVFLNPLVWVYASFSVQRELYMFLIQQFDNDLRLLCSHCRLPRTLDIIRQYYWDVKSKFAIGSKPLLHPVTRQIVGERPNQDEIRKIRLLLLSLGEMSLRQNIVPSDMKALVAFFETSQDMACIEDVLHMAIRAISQKSLLASFLDQVNAVGGCHIFVNLLQREFESIRLLSLQFLGKLLVGCPSEKKGSRFFNLAVGRSRPLSESSSSVRMQPIISAISERLFRFPQTENLCATLFDVLLGGASPKQVLQKQSQAEKRRSRGSSSHFVLPQMLALIFRFLSECNEPLSRLSILRDLTGLLDSSPSNIEALMEHGWNAWLAAVVKLDGLSNRVPNSGNRADNQTNEYILVKNLFCVVLVYHVLSVKGGWQQLEEMVNFLSMHSVEGAISYQHLLRDIFDDLIQKLVDLSSEDNIFVLQPCRDNTLYLLKLVDEMLISELDNKLPFPASGSDFSLVSLDLDSYKEFSFALQEVLQGESKDQLSRNSQAFKHPCADEDTSDNWWSLYDNLWVLICAINGKGPNKASSKPATSPGPSFGQRARGLVESLNIPAAEMAAVVVSGGISNALGTKPSKSVDKAMLLRGERCPRIVFRLVILYQCQSSLERASRCVQQFVSLLPSILVADDEQSKTRLQLFIWALLSVRSRYGVLDDGARFHVISRLIRETVNCGKSVLATSMASRDDLPDSGSNSKETGTIESLIQKDRVLSAVAEEAKYMKALKNDRSKQVQQLQKRIDEALAAESSSRKAFEDEIQSSLITIVSSDESRRAGFQLIQEEQQQNIAEKWMHVFRTLIDERGPWSANPFPNTASRHWKLDKTEDRWRRRQKLRQNYHFDEKLCYPPRTAPSEETSFPKNDTKYGFVGHIPEQMKRLLLKGVRRITDEGISDHGDGENESDVHNSDSDDVQIEQQSQRDKESNDDKDVVQEKMDSATSTGTEANEVLLSVPCVLVTPKRKLAGHLAIMKTALHFSGEYIVDGTGGSSVFKNLNASTPDQSKSDNKQNLPKWALQLEMESEKGLSADSTDAVSENMQKEHLKHLKRHRRWNIDKIKAVHWTRYLLRYTATEIFFSDSVAPIFFNFASTKEAKEIGTLIVTIRNELLFPKGSTKDKSGVISFVDRRVALEMAESARERWRRRDISNFEYLMILNTLSGRSYNDITQYPVFPWVLADYSSEVLDFNKSSTFRDLSKPVGALDSKRFEAFEDRYHNFCDPDIPSFYYGSHYSSMGIVLYYLLRLEPFTALHRSLQGGKFDHADRLFQSVDSTYRNCLSNTSDVKELIPEFFYMPEFLMNSNSYHFGVKQDGVPLGDVGLPPWAKGSPEEFVSRNREALESEYVSSNLHQWIDLVFGYKQRGKPAVEAANVFYYLTYEGAVDLDSMEDDLQRSAIEDQIANFGQTPIQIFRKKHPRRGPPIPIAHPLYFAPSSINLTSVALIANNPPSAVLYVGLLDSNIVLVSQGLTLSVKMWLTTQLQSGGNFTFSGSQDPFFGIGADFLSPRKIGSPLAGNAESGAQYFTTVQIAAENFLITCGNWENSFQVICLSDGRMVQSIRQHKDVVSCVAATSDGSILATGSYDTTVMVWEINRARAPEKRGRNSQLDITRKDSVISETPFHILCGHDDIITCLYVSVELDIVISGSKDGTCIFHTLREGRYVRSLRHPSGCALAKLVASPHGKIVLYADDDLSLNLFSINGKHLASCESNGRLNCLELSSCGEFLACAGDQGQIVVRSMSSLDIIQRYNGVGKIITSLRVTPEECFLAGTKDGSLLVYSIENPQLRKGHPRNAKLKSSAV